MAVNKTMMQYFEWYLPNDGLWWKRCAAKADNLAELVLTAWDKKQMQSGELALMGSMCKHYPVIRGRLTARIRAALPEVNIIEPRGTPSEGAAWMAADCFG